MPGVQLTNTNGALDSVNFGSPPTCSVAPTTDSQLANKQYVDDSVDAIDVTNATFSQPILQILLDLSGNNKNNTALGQYSLLNYYSTSIGVDNTAVGNEALKFNTTGTSNTAVSANALQFNTTGINNTAVGYNSLPYNNTGINNTAIGYNSLPNAPGGHYNTAVGVNSMRSMSNNSQYSVAIGYDAGNSSTWGNDSYGITLLGAGTSINGVYQFSTAVGSTAQIKKSNQIVLGTANEVVTIPRFTTAGVVHNLANGDLTSSLIVAADITDSTITSAKIADSNVTTAKIADSNVTTAKIADSNVTTAKIADSNVTTAKIADSNVTTAKIADSNVTTAKIATGAITSEKILDGTILGSDISSNTITADNIANGTITSAKIGTGVIVSTNIAEATITSNNLISNLDLSGNPTTTTQSSNDNSTRIATTAFVKNQNYITSSSLGVMNLSAPASPVDGSFYFDTISGNFRIYYSDAWKDFAQIA